jgi:hypothetical protein
MIVESLNEGKKKMDLYCTVYKYCSVKHFGSIFAVFKAYLEKSELLR